MKIMFFSELATGGAEKVAAVLAGKFVEKRHQVSVISFKSKNSQNYDIDDRVTIFYVYVAEEEKFRVIKRLHKIWKIVGNIKPDCIISLTTGGIYPLLAAKAVKGKLILSERSNPNKNMGMKDKLNKWISLRNADAIVFQTEYAKKQYSNRMQKKGIIIPNPLDSNLPDVYTGIRENRVVAAGRMITAKNYPMLFAAFKKFAQKYTEYVLEVYGDGPKEQELRKLVEQDDILREKVIFRGFVSEVNKEIRMCAMYVSSSNHEGLSNSVLEALAMGIPTISTDCPAYGAREYIKNNVTGILIPVGDIERLYSAMCLMIEQDWLNKDFSDNAEDIRQRLNATTIADRWLMIIERLQGQNTGV